MEVVDSCKLLHCLLLTETCIIYVQELADGVTLSVEHWYGVIKVHE